MPPAIDLRGRERIAEVRRREDRDARRRLRREALRRLEVGHARAERPDHAPAARERPGCDGGRADDLHPERDASSAPRRPAATSARTITPIVFCASFVPCASATSELEPIWPTRKPRCDGPCGVRSVNAVRDPRRDKAAAPATNGASTAGNGDLRDHACPVDAARAGRGEHRADDAADQRVRRGRRDRSTT